VECDAYPHVDGEVLSKVSDYIGNPLALSQVHSEILEMFDTRKQSENLIQQIESMKSSDSTTSLTKPQQHDDSRRLLGHDFSALYVDCDFYDRSNLINYTYFMQDALSELGVNQYVIYNSKVYSLDTGTEIPGGIEELIESTAHPIKVITTCTSSSEEDMSNSSRNIIGKIPELLHSNIFVCSNARGISNEYFIYILDCSGNIIHMWKPSIRTSSNADNSIRNRVVCVINNNVNIVLSLTISDHIQHVRSGTRVYVVNEGENFSSSFKFNDYMRGVKEDMIEYDLLPGRLMNRLLARSIVYVDTDLTNNKIGAASAILHGSYVIRPSNVDSFINSDNALLYNPNDDNNTVMSVLYPALDNILLRTDVSIYNLKEYKNVYDEFDFDTRALELMDIVGR